MQMCAWRKLLDVGPSINSRNLVDLHMTLTLVPAASAVLELLLHLLSSFTGPDVFCYSEAHWLRECIIGAVHEQWDAVSREICHYVALTGAHGRPSFPAWPQLSITASAVIRRGKGQGSGE